MKIMVVDDSPRIRKLLRILIDNKNDFSECGSGTEAIKKYAEFLPDWVLMDIEMPEMDGFEASSKILADYPNAKILMVTQYDEPEFRRKAEKIGIVDYILKDNLNRVLEYVN
ncbi:MAG: response regulator [Chlorobi bacterium]|nr:response regulator [Chlorobiota bacterium]